MGGVVDRLRRPTSEDGRALFTGLALLGDAWACTNPSLGRGMTLGLMHARLLRDTVRSHLHDSLELAEAWDAVTEAQMTPWYWETVAEDRGRLREIEALRDGVQPQRDESAGVIDALLAAMLHDADVFRAFLESRCCLTRLGESLAREGMTDRIFALAAEHERFPLPGPSREELLALLA